MIWGFWGSKPSHLMLFTFNLIQLAKSPLDCETLAVIGMLDRSLWFKQRRRKLHQRTHRMEVI